MAMADDTLDLRKPKSRAPQRRRPTAKSARKTGHLGSAKRKNAGGLKPRLPRPPGPDGGESRIPPVIGWDHLLVDGSDAEFRRVLRALAAVARRLDQIHDLAGATIGLTGTRLEFLLTIAEHGRPEHESGEHESGEHESGAGRVLGPPGEPAGLRQTELAKLLDISPYYASLMSRELEAADLIERRPAPDHPGRRILVMTDAGWRAVERTAPLIAGAHNAAFAPLNARGFKALRRLAPKLDAASEAAVEILARRAGERPWRSLRELMRLSEKMGVEWRDDLGGEGDEADGGEETAEKD